MEHRNFRGTEALGSTSYFIRRSGQFIYGKQNIHKGAFGIIPAELDGFETTQDLPTFDFDADCYPLWFFYFLSRNALYEPLELKMSGTGSKRLHPEVFLQLSITIPSLPEQQKIAACLTSLDELIAAQTQKIEALKTHKKGLMQQLFPQEGETTPRLRFPEFRGEGEWEVKKVSEVSEIYKGRGISKSDIVADGNQLCIRYGELYTLYGEVIKKVVSRTNTPTSTLFLSKKNDVIIPSSGETKIDIATASCVTLDNIALGGDLNVIRTRLNGIFLSYYLNGPLKYEIAKKAQGDTVVHLYPIHLEQLYIAFPDTPEQQKIAACLTSLDELIKAQTQKIEALKTHKQGLMQQLFPVVG